MLMRPAAISPCVAKHARQPNKTRTTRVLVEVEPKEERKLKLRLKRLTATGRKDDLPWNRNSVVWQIVRSVVRLASLDSRMGS
jgi:hypothetical protein